MAGNLRTAIHALAVIDTAPPRCSIFREPTSTASAFRKCQQAHSLTTSLSRFRNQPCDVDRRNRCHRRKTERRCECHFRFIAIPVPLMNVLIFRLLSHRMGMKCIAVHHSMSDSGSSRSCELERSGYVVPRRRCLPAG